MNDFRNIQLTETTPVTEPVTLDQIKEWLQIDFADHDDLLTGMITGARQTLEQYLNLALVAKSVSLEVVTTKRDFVKLPYAMEVDTVVVTELDDEWNETVLTLDDDYLLRGTVLRLDEGHYLLTYNVVPHVTEDIREAIKMEVTERFARRGETNKEYASSVNGLSEAAIAKARPHQQIWL